MKLYKVATAVKKNVFIRTEFTVTHGLAEGKTFFTEEWYRWGSCTIETEDFEVPPRESDDPYAHPFVLDDWNVVDQESDDGCTFQLEFGEEWTEEEKEHIEQLWDDGDFWDNVEVYDVWTDYYGPLEITEIDDC